MSDRIQARMTSMFGADVAAEIVAGGRFTVSKDRGGGFTVCAEVSGGSEQGVRHVRIFFR